MKKTVYFLILVLALVPLFSTGVFASTKQDVVDAAKEAVPSKYSYLYLIQLENIFSQIDVSEETCDRIIAIIRSLALTVEDSGHTLHLYGLEKRRTILEQFNEVCKLCGLTYAYRPAAVLDHTGDIVCMIYGPDGALLGEFDGDEESLVKKTNAADIHTAPSQIFPITFTALTAIALLFANSRKTVV